MMTALSGRGNHGHVRYRRIGPARVAVQEPSGASPPRRWNSWLMVLETPSGLEAAHE